MSNEGDEDDEKVTKFPGPGGKRPKPNGSGRRILEIANDSKTAREPIIVLPPLTKYLCLFLAVIMAALHFMPLELSSALVFHLGFMPARYSGGMDFGWQAFASPVAHMFLHGGWLHLGINIGMLMAFGAQLEKAAGMRKFLLVYFISGLGGALAHFIFYPTGMNPLIGASGAISGLFGAVLMLLSEEGALGRPGWRGLAPAALIWVGVSLFFGFFGMPGEDAAIAWTAHIGGFAAGLFCWKQIARLKIR